MKNFPIINPKDNKEYWISRAIAVVVCIFAKDILGNTYVLAVQRGSETPDPEFVGAYCAPCGYLDYDETIVQAAQREVREETGLDLLVSDFKLVSINDNPKDDKRQNITFRYVVNSLVPVQDLKKLLTDKNSEKNEVSDIRFIMVDEMNFYKWAFNHKELIKDIYDSINIRH